MIAINFLSEDHENVVCVPVSGILTSEGIDNCIYACNGDYLIAHATHLACSLSDRPSLWTYLRENWVSLHPGYDDYDPIKIWGSNKVGEETPRSVAFPKSA